MADLAEVFPVLADATTGAGEALISRTEGEASSGIAGSIGFAFKDASGHVVLPELDVLGRLPVTTQSVGVCKYARGLHASGSQTVGTAATAATLALTASKWYSSIDMVASCFRAGVVQLVWNDNGSESIVADAIVGPGQFTVNVAIDCLRFQAGATGTQELLVKFTPTDKVSDFRATVAALEEA